MPPDTYTLDPHKALCSGRFHCTNDGHNKWWKFTYDRTTSVFISEWGSLDSTAVSDNTRIDISAREAEAIVTSKLRKGYYPVDELAETVRLTEPPSATVDTSEGTWTDATEQTNAWADAIDAAAEQDYVVEDLVEWLSTQTDNVFAQDLVAFYDEKGFLTPKQIEAGQATRKEITEPITEPGVYHYDGVEYRVQRAKKGHFYALAYDPKVYKWELARGVMKHLRASMRVRDIPV